MFHKKLVMLCGVVLLASLGSCASIQTYSLRKERKHVHERVKVGQNILEAQEQLKKEGFRLVHPKPIYSTQCRSYQQQIVDLPSGRTTGDDTFFYVITGGANPFRFDSGSVIISASPDGVITKVE